MGTSLKLHRDSCCSTHLRESCGNKSKAIHRSGTSFDFELQQGKEALHPRNLNTGPVLDSKGELK